MDGIIQGLIATVVGGVAMRLIHGYIRGYWRKRQQEGASLSVRELLFFVPNVIAITRRTILLLRNENAPQLIPYLINTACTTIIAFVGGATILSWGAYLSIAGFPGLEVLAYYLIVVGFLYLLFSAVCALPLNCYVKDFLLPVERKAMRAMIVEAKERELIEQQRRLANARRS